MGVTWKGEGSALDTFLPRRDIVWLGKAETDAPVTQSKIL